MATKFLRKIIVEELRKVLKEESFGVDTPYGSSETMSMGGPPERRSTRVGNPKVKKLQNLLASAGYNVGKIDGIPGPLLFKAISDANGDMSGVKVSPDRVAKDFMSAGSSSADDFISMFSNTQELAALRKANVKKAVDKATAGIDNIMKQGQGDTGVTKPVKPEPRPTDKVPMGTKGFGPRDPEVSRVKFPEKVEQPVVPKLSGLDEAISRELRKLLRKV